MRPSRDQASSRSSIADDDGVPGLLADGLADLGLHRQLVRAVAHRHERAPERMAVDRPADLDEAAGAEERHRLGPDDVGPAALARALLQRRGELCLHATSFRLAVRPTNARNSSPCSSRHDITICYGNGHVDQNT